MTATASLSELDELRSTLREYFSERFPEEHLRKVIDEDPGYDVTLWRELSAELGVVGLAVPTEFGGDGYGFAELRVVLEEMGRVLLPGPYLSTVVLGVWALLASEDPDSQARYLPGIAEGVTTVAFAVAELDGRWDVNQLETTARAGADGVWQITGRKSFVIGGATADVILVVVASDSGPTLFAVEGSAAGLQRSEMRVLDPTRRLADIEFDGVTAALVGRPGDAKRVVGEVLDRFMVALAAEQTGAARACLEASSSYALERVQFGKQIGSFQAVKHKCADMLVRLQLANAAVTEAADAADGAPGAPDLGVAAAVAHAVCSDALMFVAAENIQIHGGIGFTWEHAAHFYFRRAKSAQLCTGGPAVYYERVLQRMGI